MSLRTLAAMTSPQQQQTSRPASAPHHLHHGKPHSAAPHQGRGRSVLDAPHPRQQAAARKAAPSAVRAKAAPEPSFAPPMEPPYIEDSLDDLVMDAPRSQPRRSSAASTVSRPRSTATYGHWAAGYPPPPAAKKTDRVARFQQLQKAWKSSKCVALRGAGFPGLLFSLFCFAV